MKTKALALLMNLAIPAMVLAAGPEAGHGEHGPQAGAAATVKEGAVAAVATIVVFTLVFAILAVKVWPTIGKALDERANKIRDEIEAAEMARKQAKDSLDEYQAKLAEARAEAQRMIDQAKSQQLAVAASEKAKLEAELSKERERALRDIEAAKRAAVAELYSQSAVLATTLASKILKRNINTSDHQQLIEESLGQMQGMRN
jgi:F-type H+-transporting ATPase subunit b